MVLSFVVLEEIPVASCSKLLFLVVRLIIAFCQMFFPILVDLVKSLILYIFLQSFNFKRLLHIVTGVYCSNFLGCFQNCWLFGFYPQFVKFRLLHLHGRLPIAPCSNKMFFARSAKMCIRTVQLQDTKAHLIRGDMLSFGMDFRSKKHIHGYIWYLPKHFGYFTRR